MIKGIFGFCSLWFVSLYLLMSLAAFEEEDRLVNVSQSSLGVLRPLSLPFENKAFSFCVPRDRWDKEFFKVEGG